MKLTNKYTLLAIVTILAAVAGVVFYVFSNPLKSLGNVSAFQSPCRTGTATTSTTGLSYGRSTTTLTCQLTPSGTNTAVNTASLNLWYAATSSVMGQLGFEYWFSNDNIDYYPDTYISSQIATSSPTRFSPVNQYIYVPVATTSVDLFGGAVKATTTVTVEIPNPQRAKYLKIYFYTATNVTNVNSTNSVFWAEIVPKKETN